MPVYTIGYGGRSPEELLSLLRDAGVRTVVDVRLRPDRASMGTWAKANTPDKGIERVLAAAGIAYRSLPELGNVFMDDPNWRVRYEALLDAAGPLLIERLERVEEPYCLLCAEKKSADCHRRLIAAYLERTRGVQVTHLE
jgi:uncharacterized protein (DUF488 family)